MKYAAIVNLGANCSPALQLQKRNLRRLSFPFDWFLMHKEDTVKYLCRGFKNRFSELALKENLVELQEGDDLYVRTNGGHVGYYDNATGFRILHLFDRRISEADEYAKKRAVLKKRIDRLFDVFSGGGAFLLIVATEIRISVDLMAELHKTLNEVFPASSFSLRLMQFNSEWNGVREYSWGSLCGYGRKMCEYDYFKTSYEWSFLDDVGISGGDGGKKKRSLIFKLWKHLGKILLKRHEISSLGQWSGR